MRFFSWKCLGVVVSIFLCLCLLIYVMLGEAGLMKLGLHGYGQYYIFSNEVKVPRSVEFDAFLNMMKDLEESYADYEPPNLDTPEGLKQMRAEGDMFISLFVDPYSIGSNDVCPRTPNGISKKFTVLHNNYTLSFFSVAWPGTEDSEKAVLFFHGGGFIAGSPDIGLSYFSRFSRLTRSRVYALDYALAPEFKLPYSYDESTAAYEYLTTIHNPSDISVGGDSSGGGVTVAVLQRIIQRNLKVPSSSFLISPMVDLSITYSVSHEKDLKIVTDLAVPDDKDPKSPEISPIFGSFEGFPPTFLAFSKGEEVEGECRELVKRMESSVEDLEILVPPHEMLHVWLMICTTEGIEDSAVLASWIRKRW